MNTYASDFSLTLAQLSAGVIEASVEELRSRDLLTMALRDALRYGADINDLSAITGLTCREIRRRVDANLNVLSEDALLAVA